MQSVTGQVGCVFVSDTIGMEVVLLCQYCVVKLHLNLTYWSWFVYSHLEYFIGYKYLRSLRKLYYKLI